MSEVAAIEFARTVEEGEKRFRMFEQIARAYAEFWEIRRLNYRGMTGEIANGIREVENEFARVIIGEAEMMHERLKLYLRLLPLLEDEE